MAATAVRWSGMVTRLQASAAHRVILGITSDVDVFIGWFRPGELEAVAGMPGGVFKTIFEKYCGRGTKIPKVQCSRRLMLSAISHAALRILKHYFVRGPTMKNKFDFFFL